MIRHEELKPEEFESHNKAPLDWRDFDWDRKEIHISEDTGKTGARIVPMSDNLIAWLKPYRLTEGPVCRVACTSNALWRAKKRAGLPAGKNESRNVLRKSAISYRIGLTNNRGQVAEEAGTSLEKIKSNYRRPASGTAANQWFGILPTDGEILQLDFGGSLVRKASAKISTP